MTARIVYDEAALSLAGRTAQERGSFEPSAVFQPDAQTVGRRRHGGYSSLLQTV